MSTFKEIAVFSNPIDVGLAESLLQAHEIDYFLRDRMTVEMNHYLSGAVGGVKLDVHEEDVEKAVAILMENEMEYFLSAVFSESEIDEAQYKKIVLFKILKTAGIMILGAIGIYIFFSLAKAIEGEQPPQKKLYEDYFRDK